MKTLILKKSELDKLSKDVQKEIIDIFKKSENSIKLLKDRIKDLKYRKINYRSDSGIVDCSKMDDLEGAKSNLFFDVWQKTAGEQWGNCAGRKYTIRLGTKYIRVDIEFYRTDSIGSDSSEYISESKLSEILDLLEEAFYIDSQIDTDKLVSIAANRIENLFNNY